MQSYNYDSLQALAGQPITVMDDAGQQLTLKIDRVEKSRYDSVVWEVFSAYFMGDSQFRIPQGSYRLSHPDLGTETFFISPKSAVEYELVINRKR
ncbi:DUF6916 family protein [Cellvibrio mixtus]|nr:hypothetical protein [Cellvibrio mixtus]